VSARAEIPLEAQTGMSDGTEIGAGFGTELLEKVSKQVFGPFIVLSEVRLGCTGLISNSFCNYLSEFSL
jgi:hypothetical protein